MSIVTRLNCVEQRLRCAALVLCCTSAVQCREVPCCIVVDFIPLRARHFASRERVVVRCFGASCALRWAVVHSGAFFFVQWWWAVVHSGAFFVQWWWAAVHSGAFLQWLRQWPTSLCIAFWCIAFS